MSSNNSTLQSVSVKSFDVVFPMGYEGIKPPLASPQSCLLHRSLLAPKSGSQVCHGEPSTTLAHRGAVFPQETMSQRETSTVNKVPQWDRRLCAALWVVHTGWGSDCHRRAKQLLVLLNTRPEFIATARRKVELLLMVTEGTLSWGMGRGVCGPAAGRNVLGCGCSLGDHSGSGGLHVERDRGNSDAPFVRRRG